MPDSRRRRRDRWPERRFRRVHLLSFASSGASTSPWSSRSAGLRAARTCPSLPAFRSSEARRCSGARAGPPGGVMWIGGCAGAFAVPFGRAVPPPRARSRAGCPAGGRGNATSTAAPSFRATDRAPPAAESAYPPTAGFVAALIQDCPRRSRRCHLTACWSRADLAFPTVISVVGTREACPSIRAVRRDRNNFRLVGRVGRRVLPIGEATVPARSRIRAARFLRVIRTKRAITTTIRISNATRATLVRCPCFPQASFQKHYAPPRHHRNRGRVLFEEESYIEGRPTVLLQDTSVTLRRPADEQDRLPRTSAAHCRSHHLL
jgi:hypothetical protein